MNNSWTGPSPNCKHGKEVVVLSVWDKVATKLARRLDVVVDKRIHMTLVDPENAGATDVPQ